jgi:hypothetical protein
MFSTHDHPQRTTFGLGLALAAATLLLSVLVHFSADLAWLYLTATPETARSGASAPVGNAERTSLVDPSNDDALLPQAWSLPGWPLMTVRWAPILSDRALTHPPLLQPPADLRII